MVGIAAGERDGRPIDLAPTVGGLEDPLEPPDAAEQLRRQPDLIAEDLDESPATEADPAAQGADARGVWCSQARPPSARRETAGCCSNRRVGRALEEGCLEGSGTALRGRRLGQPVADLDGMAAPPARSGVHQGILELPGGRGEEWERTARQVKFTPMIEVTLSVSITNDLDRRPADEGARPGFSTHVEDQLEGPPVGGSARVGWGARNPSWSQIDSTRPDNGLRGIEMLIIPDRILEASNRRDGGGLDDRPRLVPRRSSGRSPPRRATGRRPGAQRQLRDPPQPVSAAPPAAWTAIPWDTVAR